ncbi:Endogenous inhibitor of DNA gyrase [Commensalibacter communis]|uniref:DNA gyrase inhibitor YacG n=1 Tax=Commensalibacter communis TaxID=2972786 RepID=A0A9W4XDL3_9PROT|nr:DNA gyrase inhibitor YacG [Commensalibacter communis]CAI3948895.1 Endogenous inhibitor of DNA gyrase [Commensalibacter communis]CAI3949394.1 Endogenous inhibitor of DNA gyrase [Commensalibacter communis]CAI3949486.1 Endogenous inhibitor of DNA gyrase [Commensalibacter communis]CAI3952646.1 Endogenous inhibitor of DNA gyrase [Commensalibacter communis]CAI3955005.1 Endogenous inhibitor of DNA gyrase [Commensalibacter communis]
MRNSSEKCPICKKNIVPDYTPFCSKRCANIDLSRWFSGDYRLSSEPRDEDEMEELENSLKERLDPDHNVG